MVGIKLVIVGGGGVRAPLFVSSALRRAQDLGLREICLMDVDEHKLRLFSSLCREIAHASASPVQVTSTTDARSAFEGAKYVVTTIRVGGEQSRVLDERIALGHGILGQETTGPGGHAMALRSIPAILDYAELLEQTSPGAWLFNFTNPAGLVVQALRDHGYARTVGICDSANVAQHAVADWIGLDDQNILRPEVFGLNHLSWTQRILLNGRDVLGPLLLDPNFLASTKLRYFSPELVQRIGMWLNEYLYYYYYSEQALESISAEEQTRGEEIEELNRLLIEHLSTPEEFDPQSALHAYYDYQRKRDSTYMKYADATSVEEDELQENKTSSGAEGEGYAGVALDIMEAFETGDPLYTALNVANEDAISCMRADDVVEVSCVVDGEGVRPLPIGEIPEHQELLMRSIKLYERLTIKAIEEQSKEVSVEALMQHPLVLSYSRAKALVDEYLDAHAQHVGTWS